MLSFEIGQRESGLYSEQTDRITQPPSTVLVYRYQIVGMHVIAYAYKIKKWLRSKRFKTKKVAIEVISSVKKILGEQLLLRSC